MGCASSKQPPVCQNCKTPCPPTHRKSFSVHVHHPNSKHEGESDHLVSLTSSTLGSFKLDSFYQTHRRSEANAGILDCKSKINLDEYGKRNFSIEVIEAKTWSRLIEEKISKAVPQTPIQTPVGEPETIDAFELMAGLEDISPVHLHHHTRSVSFSFPSSNPMQYESTSNINATAMPIISDFDPDIIAAFRKSIEVVEQQAMDGNKSKPLDVTDELKSNGYKFSNKDKVIIYFTSLRGVRKTYEDCCYIRVILKGLGYKLDERDVSMHSGFKEELKQIMGDGFKLPRVFLGNKLIGGVDEIRRMHESGQLEKVFEGCEVVAGGGAAAGDVCEACGDIRFMLCEKCSGSCKVYQDDDEEFDESGFGFQRCSNCNENGLVRCPICCD